MLFCSQNCLFSDKSGRIDCPYFISTPPASITFPFTLYIQVIITFFSRYPTKIKKSLPRRAFAPRSPADLKLGYSIKFTRPGGRLSRGTVKYIGHLPTRNEIFIGVELDGYGKHT